MHQTIPTLRLAAALLLAAAFSACSTPPARVTVYDFGPGATSVPVANRMAPLPPLVLTDVEAPAAFEGSALLYRLGYADAQQLRPYAQARWTMAPAQLLRQRLRALLGQRRSVFAPIDAPAPGTLTLRVELEEFSQLFDSPDSSQALVRVRATVGRSGFPARPLAQTTLVAQQSAASADAAGGARALAQASDALVLQLDTWLQQVAKAEPASP